MDEPIPFDRGMAIEAPDYARLKPCMHREVELDVEHRDVICKRCDKVLDPFETLLMYSNMRAKRVRRHDDAETAEEAVKELVSAGGALRITSGGAEATITKDGKRRRSLAPRHAESFWGGVVQACRNLGIAMGSRRKAG